MADDDEYKKQLELQRKAFEAQFGSLESMGFEDKTKQHSEDESVDSDGLEGQSQEESGSEIDAASDAEGSFQGFSGDETAEIDKRSESQPKREPKVIKFDGGSDVYAAPNKKEQRLVRSGKAPRQSLAEARLQEEMQTAGQNSQEEDTADGEKENLQNDLELQRFLKESHLLSAFGRNEPSGADLTLQTMNNVEYRDDQVFGKARSRTLEMRLKNLSSTNGKGQKLEKVPINIRKGMVDKHIKKIKKHEQDARDGGIILSKVKKGEFRKIDSTYRKDIERRIGNKNNSADAQRRAKRQKGLRVSSIGRSTRNGLIISPEEIKRINGDGKSKSKGRR
ncbi:Faf1p LALA0_S01e15038g [Lachancea lanzarotensis]|uniref:LALA0S01e15038g1_1 n=1 Tax=Lachancea lanzarotensis TaxID=1245769 RepID=A0A0C7MTG5_9SACH|nr:uncharacterized protein LALA0_S01e15038g [Lachancea lanzarotensis]CEP60616.1 LALA0S01e15038g1_1 [Lachancea lanzarotensis]